MFFAFVEHLLLLVFRTCRQVKVEIIKGIKKQYLLYVGRNEAINDFLVEENQLVGISFPYNQNTYKLYLMPARHRSLLTAAANSSKSHCTY